MTGSTFGNIFRVTTWGESHGAGIGAVVDGVPAGLSLTEEDIQPMLDRRKPGQSRYTTKRNEADEVHILSGTFEGKTTGTPIALEVLNTSQRSKDYSEIAKTYRPGHADYTYDQKYGFRDYRGGGRSSGRETIGRVAAGAIAKKFLLEFGIDVHAWAHAIGPVEASSFDLNETTKNPFCLPDAEAATAAADYVEQMMAAKDSVGGIIACEAMHVPAGLGDPVFEKLDANLAKAILSIGAVKGIEFGEGFAASRLNGSANNDAFRMKDGSIIKKTNHAGGILGGISDGSPIYFKAAVKPTPSIFQPQETVTNTGENYELTIAGRHDPIIVPRAVVVVEAMTCLTLADAMLMNLSAQMDNVKKFYNN